MKPGWRHAAVVLAGIALAGIVIALAPMHAQDAAPDPAQAVSTPAVLTVEVGKSLLVESALPIERISVGYGDIAAASAVTPREVLLNGKAPGVTSLIVWQRGGGKVFFDVKVRAASVGSTSRVEAIERELKRELPGRGC